MFRNVRRKKGTWQLHKMVNGKMHYRNFGDKLYGDSTQALAAALEHRAKLEKQVVKRPRKLNSNNTHGVSNIKIMTYESGNQSLVALATKADGTITSKSWILTKYSYLEAKRLAIIWQQSQSRLRESLEV